MVNQKNKLNDRVKKFTGADIINSFNKHLWAAYQICAMASTNKRVIKNITSSWKTKII